MDKKKFVPFDYQRYLDGDDVFNEIGEKVKQLTRFIDLHELEELGKSYCMVGVLGKRIVFADTKGVYQGEQYLFMLSKNKTLWIGIDKSGCLPHQEGEEKCYPVTHAHESREGVIETLKNNLLNVHSWKIIEIEVEE